jgi:hypothetical protein
MYSPVSGHPNKAAWETKLSPSAGALRVLPGRRTGPGLLLLGLTFSLAVTHPAVADVFPDPQTGAAGLPAASGLRDADRLAAWVIETKDNHGLPFMIVDKVNAEALAFDRQGLLIGAAAALVGFALGDDSPPGIGDRLLADISPGERVTAAGRFVAARGVNLKGMDILWLDYNDALSLHAMIEGTELERRQQRMDSATALDNRISYGCINVPAEFYERIVRPLFSFTSGIVYVLPETRSIEDEFFTPTLAGAPACSPGSACSGSVAFSD